MSVQSHRGCLHFVKELRVLVADAVFHQRYRGLKIEKLCPGMKSVSRGHMGVAGAVDSPSWQRTGRRREGLPWLQKGDGLCGPWRCQGHVGPLCTSRSGSLGTYRRCSETSSLRDCNGATWDWHGVGFDVLTSDVEQTPLGLGMGAERTFPTLLFFTWEMGTTHVPPHRAGGTVGPEPGQTLEPGQSARPAPPGSAQAHCWSLDLKGKKSESALTAFWTAPRTWSWI